MERRGIYRKGSAGHVRNINVYRYMRQHSKKWSVPLTALLAVVLAFTTAPMVGEDFQASVFKDSVKVASQSVAKTVKNDVGKKALLSALTEFTSECKRFKMSECEKNGGALINDIASAKGEISILVKSAEAFAETFQDELSANACRFDLQNALVNIRNTEGVLDNYFEKYGDEFSESDLTAVANDLNLFKDQVKKLANQCAGIYTR